MSRKRKWWEVPAAAADTPAAAAAAAADAAEPDHKKARLESYAKMDDSHVRERVIKAMEKDVETDLKFLNLDLENVSIWKRWNWGSAAGGYTIETESDETRVRSHLGLLSEYTRKGQVGPYDIINVLNMYKFMKYDAIPRHVELDFLLAASYYNVPALCRIQRAWRDRKAKRFVRLTASREFVEYLGHLTSQEADGQKQRSPKLAR